MPPKGGKKARSKFSKRTLYRKYGGAKVANNAARTIQAAVRRTLQKNIETKKGCFSSPDGTEITHNNFVVLNSKILATTQGTLDPQVTSILNRIGDEINLRGVSIKFMVELNERYTNVTFRFMIVKSAKGDVPTRDTLFNGQSGNKMIDTFNTERYTIIKSKTFKMEAANATYTYNDSLVPPAPAGGGTVQAGYYSRQTRIMKFWIDGKKFTKSGVIRYENGSDQPKFYDYHALLYCYSNYSTNQDLWNVGRLNDYIQVIYFKDA